ncbi:MAG: glutamate-5-semialdehyde dehydrogenase [Candidatus Omnitrophota bacterium]
MPLRKDIIDIAKRAKEASHLLRLISSGEKNKALALMADAVLDDKKKILEANKKDIKAAQGAGKNKAFIDRLLLTEERLKSISTAIKEVIDLPDPTEEIASSWIRPNGLKIEKVRVPIGVIGIIYESRPNVTADCAVLCLKSGNAAVLRGGSLSFNSNMAIFKVISRCVKEAGLPSDCIQMISTTDRKAVDYLLAQSDYVNLIIPRGGESLIKEISRKSRVPVIKHAKGLCHIYVDEDADLNMAENIIFNAKTQRPSVCNAVETLLVHKDIAARFIPHFCKKFKEAGVEIRGCEITRKLAENIKPAQAKDWDTEYLDLILSVKVVDSLKEAAAHIKKYSSGLAEAIITESYTNAAKFLKEVDSACVYVNASTRFTDGNQFGLGAEIGISTDKIHARGPVGLRELTIHKYVVYGSGQVRE